MDHYFRQRGLCVPSGLNAARVLAATELPELAYRLDPGVAHCPSVGWARELAASSPWPMPDNLFPLLPVDDESFACVVVAPLDRPDLPGAGVVVRWHLGLTRPEQQAALLDTDAGAYVTSVVEELAARPRGLTRILDEIGPAYEVAYLGKSKRPRDFVIRPVRIACQNVIIGLAAFAHDSGIDGMGVLAWQTCEVPHVATHEANRALAALMLCDAYSSGGTMEIRFDRPARLSASGVGRSGAPLAIETRYRGHPEMRVPASLRRFARAAGFELGADDPAAVSPREARLLFRAVTPMPPELAARVDAAVDAGIATPERFCYALLADVWRPIELDYLLATTDRAGSILAGGADWQDRDARRAEAEVSRVAVLLGMLFRRLNATDAAAADGSARLIEDMKVGVRWHIDPQWGSVRFTGLADGMALPWTDRRTATVTEVTVYPRAFVTEATAARVAADVGAGVSALAVPADCDLPQLPPHVVVLVCPDRTEDLDKAVERKLLAGRTTRA
ncbi:hypothetical protein ACFYTF_14925 [Nocardia thailandica]|uniref:Uncharacterized protein n=1 Tax=Nocardia thailandica TaxID=257275 RepID=A0ABW6PNY9_9NOCA